MEEEEWRRRRSSQGVEDSGRKRRSVIVIILFFAPSSSSSCSSLSHHPPYFIFFLLVTSCSSLIFDCSLNTPCLLSCFVLCLTLTSALLSPHLLSCLMLLPPHILSHLMLHLPILHSLSLISPHLLSFFSSSCLAPSSLFFLPACLPLLAPWANHHGGKVWKTRRSHQNHSFSSLTSWVGSRTRGTKERSNQEGGSKKRRGRPEELRRTEARSPGEGRGPEMRRRTGGPEPRRMTGVRSQGGEPEQGGVKKKRGRRNQGKRPEEDD